MPIKSAADFDTRCACPHNQSSGAICAHAVAVGLAALRGTANLTTKPPASPALPEQAWDIHFAPNWREALGRGHLAATLSRNPEPLTPAGQALDAWLAGAGAAAKSPLHLQLEHSRLATFLDALIGHPRITIGKAHTPLEILATGKIQLRELTLENSHVRLIPEPDAPQPLAIAGRFWQIGPDSIARIGEANLPADHAVQ